MGNPSNPGPSTATNGTAASITTTATPSVQLNPTIVTTLITERIEGCHGSFTTIVVSASPTETSTSTGVTSSFTTSAASTTPLSHTNHSTSATNTSPSTFTVSTSSPTLIIPGIYTDPSETHGSFSSSAGTIASSTAVPNREQGQEMPTGRKVGLAMIPIAVGLCAWAIVLLFLWRRRKVQKSHQRLMSISSRPEKNYSHLLPSLGSSFRASRVFTMTAFHIPDSESQRSRITSESLGGGVHALTCDSVGAPGKVPVTSPPRSTSSPGKKKAPSNPDSPIDEGSPFRLTREDTRRKSLGAEISHLWPSPPPSAWTKRQEILEQLPSSRFGRDMSLPRTQRLNRSSSQSPPRTARSIDKPAVGESWPLL